jgi:hypothetical protein
MQIQATTLILAGFEIFDLVRQEARRQQVPFVDTLRQVLAGLEEVDIEKVPEDIIPGWCGVLFDAAIGVHQQVLRMVLNEVDTTLEVEEQVDDELIGECVMRVKDKVIRLSHYVAVTEKIVAPLRE